MAPLRFRVACRCLDHAAALELQLLRGELRHYFPLLDQSHLHVVYLRIVILETIRLLLLSIHDFSYQFVIRICGLELIAELGFQRKIIERDVSFSIFQQLPIPFAGLTAYLLLLSEPFHSEHKALDRETLIGTVEFNVPAIEIYVSPPGVFITGPLLACLLIVLVTTARMRYSLGILYCGVVSSELKSLEYRMQPCRQGPGYRLRSVGWIEAWVHTRLEPPDCHVFQPYCSRETDAMLSDYLE
uniref:Uncharacterized protein n=1 Tax=Glossina palpalis gambiensis TaxID=67801 RepID=A0A1B0BA28_9MUSC